MRTRSGNVMVVVGGLVLLVVIGSAAALIANRTARETPEQEQARLRAEALSELRLVAFEGTAPDGSTVSNTQFAGSWTLLSFGFTHCQLACPPMHANTMRLMSTLEPTGLRYVTLSVDPVYDTPERLAAYTKQLGIDQDVWTFLALDGETRDRVLAGLGMGISVDESEANRIALPGGETVMNNIDHPTRFILIGPEGRVVDLYPGLEGDQIETIARSIRSHIAG